MCCCHFDTILSPDFDQDLSRGLVTFTCYLWRRVSLGSTLQRTFASDFSSPLCLKVAQKSRLQAKLRSENSFEFLP